MSRYNVCIGTGSELHKVAISYQKEYKEKTQMLISIGSVLGMLCRKAVEFDLHKGDTFSDDIKEKEKTGIYGVHINEKSALYDAVHYIKYRYKVVTAKNISTSAAIYELLKRAVNTGIIN